MEETQIGSSAMAYKRNPMRSERIASLSRYLIAEASNAPYTASVQWLERTLDDSANRRLSMPECFLAADSILRLVLNVSAGLVVNETVIAAAVREYLPFIATENLMMEAVKRGGDRQKIHEILRRCSFASSAEMKQGKPCDLIQRLAAEPEFGLSENELQGLLDPAKYVGRSAEQTAAYVRKVRPLTEGEARVAASIEK